MSDTDWGLHALRLESARQVLAELSRDNGALPSPDSPFAWMSVADERERAVRLVLLDSVRLQLSAAADHLAGVGAMIRAPVVSRAFFTVVRSVLDALSPAWWILSPGMTVRPVELGVEDSPTIDTVTARVIAARLLCYLAADLRRYAKVVRALHGTVNDPGVPERFERYAAWAESVAPGRVVGRPDQAKWSVGGVVWPDFTKMVGDLAAIVDQPAPATNPYQFLSAITHVHPSFVVQGATTVAQSEATGMRMMNLNPSAPMIDCWTRYASRALYGVALAVVGIHGWQTDTIQQWYLGWRLLPMVGE